MEASGCCETLLTFYWEPHCHISEVRCNNSVCFLRLLDKICTLQLTGTEIQNVIYEKEENRLDNGRKHAVENIKDAKNW